jgi:hypothetical protein
VPPPERAAPGRLLSAFVALVLGAATPAPQGAGQTGERAAAPQELREQRQPRSVPTEMSAAEARPAKELALQWICDTQRADGSWGSSTPATTSELGFSIESFHAWRVASHALALEALRTAEPNPRRADALERGLVWLCTARLPLRGSDWDNDAVWSALYGSVACAALARDARFAAPAWQELLSTRGREFVAQLERNQVPDGGWGYYDDPIYSSRPKWGTSFSTALVLPTLRSALELGWLEDARVLERAQRYVQACALPGGAYSYSLDPIPALRGGEHINLIKGSLGRTQVCNWALAQLGDQRVPPERLRRGLDAFFEHHRFLDVARLRPVPHEAYYQNAGYFYFFGHYYAAQAIECLPPQEREEWHRKLRPHLVKTQNQEGHVNDFFGTGMRLASTSFLALALELGEARVDATNGAATSATTDVAPQAVEGKR